MSKDFIIKLISIKKIRDSYYVNHINHDKTFAIDYAIEILYEETIKSFEVYYINYKTKTIDISDELSEFIQEYSNIIDLDKMYLAIDSFHSDIKIELPLDISI